MIENKPLVVIMGPTASGKTSLAVDVCKEINGEVVTADSMQVYRKMNIGTAKPTLEEMQSIEHHMIDLVNPDENYSLGEYVKEAKKVIESIYKKGKIPVLAGGTGLYIDTLIQGTVLSDGENDEEYRKELYSLAEKNGNEFVYNMLKQTDEKSALSIHPNNLKRVIRALEFYKVTNKKQSEHISEGKKESEYKLAKFCLFPERDALYDKINRRVDLMIDSGLVNEVKELLDKYCSLASEIYKFVLGGLH
jgi:tRNA dimethylallyltransferase